MFGKIRHVDLHILQEYPFIFHWGFGHSEGRSSFAALGVDVGSAVRQIVGMTVAGKDVGTENDTHQSVLVLKIPCPRCQGACGPTVVCESW